MLNVLKINSICSGLQYPWPQIISSLPDIFLFAASTRNDSPSCLTDEILMPAKFEFYLHDMLIHENLYMIFFINIPFYQENKLSVEIYRC